MWLFFSIIKVFLTLFINTEPFGFKRKSLSRSPKKPSRCSTNGTSLSWWTQVTWTKDHCVCMISIACSKWFACPCNPVPLLNILERQLNQYNLLIHHSDQLFVHMKYYLVLTCLAIVNANDWKTAKFRIQIEIEFIMEKN